MKWFLVVLIFLNLLFFGYTEIRQDRATESLLAHQNFNSEKIRILPAALTSAQAAAPIVAVARTCSEWGPVAGADLANIRKIIDPLLLTQQVRENVMGSARYRVYIPPYASEAQATQRLEALKTAGISDSLIIRDDPALRNGISLGVLKDEAAARMQLEALKQKGVNDARIIAQTKPDTPVNFLFVLEDAAVKLELDKLIQTFPDVVAKEVSCPPATA